jgi:hypothetical protein
VSARLGVRPITILTPEDFEGLMAVGSHGTASVCSLLAEKTQEDAKWGPLDVFLFSKITDPGQLRLPFMNRRFGEIVDGSLERMTEFGLS